MEAQGIRHHRESVTVKASAETLYDLVSDITRTGEWSPICTSCWWDDKATAGQIGAKFTGRNELPNRTWESRSQVIVAERGQEFAWEVGDRFVRWGYILIPTEAGTLLCETWEFLPGGIAMFEEQYGSNAQSQIAERTQQALNSIPVTLAAIKRIAESIDESQEIGSR
jgi:hypothetical protein